MLPENKFNAVISDYGLHIMWLLKSVMYNIFNKIVRLFVGESQKHNM